MSRNTTPHSSPVFYGGQAVIEGVMMRGVQHFAVACRRANGDIALTAELVPKVLRPNWQKWPFLRGMFALVDSMALGTRSLFWSARIAEADIPKKEIQNEAIGRRGIERPAPSEIGAAYPGNVPGPSFADETDPKSKTSRVTDMALGGALAFGLIFFVALFKLTPHLGVELLKRLGVENKLLIGLADFVLRFSIFLIYVVSISRMQYIYCVFQYHGAEHKAINTLEAGLPLTVEAAREASRLHPRCGTAFVIVVLFLSVAFVIPFYDQPLWARVLIQLALVGPVAGISFELLRLAGRYRNNPVAAFLSQPGLWAQLLTTREPDDSQLAVALTSLKAVMDAEERQKIEDSRKQATSDGQQAEANSQELA